MPKTGRERERKKMFSLFVCRGGAADGREKTVGGFRFLPFLQLAATSMSLLYKLKFKYILPPYTTTDWKKKKKEGRLFLFYFLFLACVKGCSAAVVGAPNSTPFACQPGEGRRADQCRVEQRLNQNPAPIA
jgi:hypothetical protein